MPRAQKNSKTQSTFHGSKDDEARLADDVIFWNPSAGVLPHTA
jgi:hypothetical protein